MSAQVTRLRRPKKLGTCPCGKEPIKYPKHGLGARCYGVYRRWDADRTDQQRAERKEFLALSMLRMTWVDDGLITIDHVKETVREKDRRTTAGTSSKRTLRS